MFRRLSGRPVRSLAFVLCAGLLAGAQAFDSLSTYTGKHGFFHPLKVF